MRRDRSRQETLSLSISSCWVILVLGVLLCGSITLCSQITTTMQTISTNEEPTVPIPQQADEPTQEKILSSVSSVTPTAKAAGANHETSSEATVVTAKIIEPRVNLRALPDTNAEILGKANEGEIISLIGQNADGKWYQTKMANTTNAWIFAATVKIIEGDSKTLPQIPMNP